MKPGRVRRSQRVRTLAWAVTLLLAGCGVLGSARVDQRTISPLSAPTTATATTPTSPAQQRVKRPDIVLVVMDDVSLNVLATMRHAEAMAHRGATYPHAFVVDSLCCVSRTATFTGQYPHQTGVLSNSSADDVRGQGPIGGWPAYVAHGSDDRTFALQLQRAGYVTGYVGKLLNEYEYLPGWPIPPAPRGWSDLRVVFGSAYDQWDFDMTYVADGQVEVRHIPAPPQHATDRQKDAAYAGAVIAAQALRFIRANRDRRSPYFLEVAPYGTHNRVGPGAYPGEPLFPAELRDRPGHGSPGGNCGPTPCSRLGIGDLPGFADRQDDNVPRYADGSPAPPWNHTPALLPPDAASKMLRDRARMAQSIDRMLGRILQAVSDDTYVVLTSDNGLHLGQHGLGMGKGTAYDSDIHVPLIVVGPGITAGSRADVTSDIDLAPTFEELAGLRTSPYRSGRSLVPSLFGTDAPTGGYAFIEHTQAPATADDPDRPFTADELDEIPSYVAVRSADAVLIREDLDPSWTGTDYAYEFYDLSEVPWERTNQYADPRHATEVGTLTAKLHQFDRCASEETGRSRVTRTCRALALAGP